MKGSRRGARGWIDDYELDRAMRRLSAPPLRARDFEGYVSRERLRRINRALVEQPYSGLIVVCPFARPRAFGAVGALQAAIDGSELERFAELGVRALADNPNLSLRLLTSDKDHFLRVNEQLSALLKERGVQHRYSRVQGNHSYRFNRGPGAIEMLLFHDRVLRGTAWD